MTGRQESGPVPAGVRRLVVGWAVAAVGVAGLVSLQPSAVTDTTPVVMVAVCLAIVAMNLVGVRVRTGADGESATFVEVAAVPAMLLLSPREAIVVALAAALVSEPVRSWGEVHKIVFNTSWIVAGVAAGAWTYRALAGDGAFAGDLVDISAALVAGAVLVAVNLFALAGVHALLTRRHLLALVREMLPAAIRDNLGAAILGVLVTVLLDAAPIASPLVVLLGLMLRQRQASRADGYARVAAERDRFERTVAGSSDGVVLLDGTGTIEVWNPVMTGLTAIGEDRALGSRLADLGWEELQAEGDEELRVQLAGRVLAVRRAVTGGRRDHSTVITVRDVSREAELARIRDDLVSRISHELRTPLTSLEGFLEVLTEHWQDLGDDGRRELLDASRRGSRRLSRLVANLMVWAGIESRTTTPLDPAAPPVDPIEALRDVLADIPVDDVVLEVDDDVSVAADADDVRTILANLLSNAVLYGAPPVAVTIRRLADHVELVVTDAGPGLPDEFRTEMWEPFAQASAGIQRTAKGLGMGLAIVRSLAATNGGTVAYDDLPGGGTRFTVTLTAAARLSDHDGDVATVAADG